jgi:hypothetical protein
VDTRCRAGAAKRDNLADLREREPEATALLDESEDADHIGRVDAVAGWRPVRGRQNPACFVEPYRLAGDSAPLGNLTDQQPVLTHAHTLNLAPWGKVKR